MSETKFKNVDWEDGTPFAVLADKEFFPYSGSDGDLFRKHGHAGWRVSVYGRHLVKIQEKCFGGWATVRRWEVDWENDLPESDVREFESTLEHLLEEDELPSE